MGIVGATGVSALHSGTVAARVGESGFRDFVHGTSIASANHIVSGGVRAVSTNMAPLPTGSFFTFEATRANAEIAASHFALRHTSSANARLFAGPGADKRARRPGGLGTREDGPDAGSAVLPASDSISTGGIRDTECSRRMDHQDGYVLKEQEDDGVTHLVVYVPQGFGEDEMDRLSATLTKRSTKVLLDTGILILAGVYEAAEKPKPE